MQQTSDVNNDAEALCCFRLVQSVRVQNVTYRRKCHPTHWFRCEHYSEQPCTFVHTSTPWKTDWLGSQAVVTITLTVGIRTWVYQRSVLLPGLTSAVIYSETHKLVLSLKVYGIRCLVITLLFTQYTVNGDFPFLKNPRPDRESNPDLWSRSCELYRLGHRGGFSIFWQCMGPELTQHREKTW